MKLQNSSLRKRKGFTLIELIVVIAILAILAAIAIPSFLGALNTARLRTDQASARVIAGAVRLGEAEGTYVISGTPQVLPASVQALVDAGYLDALPKVQSGTKADFAMSFTGGKITITGGGTTLYPIS